MEGKEGVAKRRVRKKKQKEKKLKREEINTEFITKSNYIFIYIYMRTRKNGKMKRRKTRRRKKGGELILEKLSKGINRFKNSMKKIKSGMDNAKIAKKMASIVSSTNKIGKNTVNKIKTAKKELINKFGLSVLTRANHCKNK